MSAKCNIARYEVIIWILCYSRNLAMQQVLIAWVVVLKFSTAQLLGDLIANDNWLNSKHEQGEILQCCEAPSCYSYIKAAPWCHGSHQQQGEVWTWSPGPITNIFHILSVMELIVSTPCVFASVSWVGAFCLKYIYSRSYVWFWSKCTLQWRPFPATLITLLLCGS